MYSLTSFTHVFRSAIAKKGLTVRLGHTQQLLAAALGHKNYASLQASGDHLRWPGAANWIIDAALLRDRATRLSVDVDLSTFMRVLSSESPRHHGPIAHISHAALQDSLMSEVNDLVVHDDAVGTEMANTNCAGPFEPELYYDELSGPALPEYGEDLVLTYRGTVNGEQDGDRPFAGDAVHVEVEATFSMLGRRICGPASLELTRAAQDWSWQGTDDDDVDTDAPPRISRAQALAEELNIPLESAETLVDVDIVQDDEHGGYFIDLSSCEPSGVVDHLLRQHKTSQIKVLGNSIDRISPFDHLTA